MENTFSIGDKVKLNLLDGPKPAGIPYDGYETTITDIPDVEDPNGCFIQAINGKEKAFVFMKELIKIN